MARKEQPISVVPVWQPQVDRQLFVRILLALVDQLVAEGSVTNDTEPEVGEVPGKEEPDV